jgi:hypothetical protein
MGKQKAPEKAAAIITGADPRHVPLFQHFAQHHFNGSIERFELIHHPDAEAAFLAPGVECRRYPKQLQCAVRDILQTRANSAWRRGINICIVIDCVATEPEDHRFGRCRDHLALELEHISSWGCFNQFAAAFFIRQSSRLVELRPTCVLPRPG